MKYIILVLTLLTPLNSFCMYSIFGKKPVVTVKDLPEDELIGSDGESYLDNREVDGFVVLMEEESLSAATPRTDPGPKDKQEEEEEQIPSARGLLHKSPGYDPYNSSPRGDSQNGFTQDPSKGSSWNSNQCEQVAQDPEEEKKKNLLDPDRTWEVFIQEGSDGEQEKRALQEQQGKFMKETARKSESLANREARLLEKERLEKKMLKEIRKARGEVEDEQQEVAQEDNDHIKLVLLRYYAEKQLHERAGTDYSNKQAEFYINERPKLDEWTRNFIKEKQYEPWFVNWVKSWFSWNAWKESYNNSSCSVM